MERKALAIPEIALISGTRAALGAGIGLLLADRLGDEQRRAVGWTLFAISAITTIPIAIQLYGSASERASEHATQSGHVRGHWVPATTE